jgi:hypothetical protein
MTRPGRVFLHPQPNTGPHPGYRGPLSMDALGVYITWDCESLQVSEDDEGIVSHEWEPALVEELVPWNRVHSVEWLDSEEPPDAA